MNKNGNKTKAKNSKRKTPLMTILFVIFILIPLTILIYFWKFYEPGKTIEQAEKDTAEQVVELDPSEASASDKDKEKDDKGQDAQGDKKAQEQSQKMLIS